MTDLPSKPSLPTRKTGLSPKEQKLQALREKLANAAPGAKPGATATGSTFRAKSNVAGPRRTCAPKICTQDSPR
jgi:hypothetical protein